MLLYICLSIIFISVLYSLYSYRKNKLSLLLSAYFIILATYGLTHHFTIYQKSPFWLAIFFNHFSPLWVIAGPCLYLYVKSTILDSPKLPAYSWVHTIPFFIYAASTGPYFIKPFAEKLDIADQIIQNFNSLKHINPNLFFTPEINFMVRSSLLLIYSLASLVLIISFYKKEKHIKTVLSNQKKTMQRWLLTLSSTSLALAVTFLIVTITFLLNNESENRFIGHPLILMSGMIFLIIALSLFFFPQILYGLPAYPSNNLNSLENNQEGKLTIVNPTPIPEERSFDESDPFVILSKKINHYLVTEKPYLSKDFSMHDIAVAMNVPNHHISYCINQIMQTNFANLKNQLRIEHSIALLENNETSTLSIEGIAQNSGFATRSSFYTAFKKVTGTTPSEYLQKEKSAQQ